MFLWPVCYKFWQCHSKLYYCCQHPKVEFQSVQLVPLWFSAQFRPKIWGLISQKSIWKRTLIRSTRSLTCFLLKSTMLIFCFLFWSTSLARIGTFQGFTTFYSLLVEVYVKTGPEIGATSMTLSISLTLLVTSVTEEAAMASFTSTPSASSWAWYFAASFSAFSASFPVTATIRLIPFEMASSLVMISLLAWPNKVNIKFHRIFLPISRRWVPPQNSILVFMPTGDVGFASNSSTVTPIETTRTGSG